jgi:serine/threonine protein kinase
MIPSPLFCDACGAANQPQASFCHTCGRPLQSAGAPSRNTATGRLLPNYLLKQRYRILDSVGKGGMGAVYRAEDTQLGNRKVAVKEMSQSGLNPQEIIEAADAFKREAYILAGLQHPNLPSIHDHFSEAGRWYLVMSFIHGETLEEYLNKAKGGRLPVEEVLQIGIQLCRVLDYLHTQQPPIIFRDLKPSNIMRTTDGHLYLIDFGIARHFKPGQTRDTAAYGSMGYASPEQYGKAQTTPRSDIYSLGAVLYQLLSGHDPSTTPFSFPSLQSQVPTIPVELATLITHMLELDENKRPTSTLVVVQKLQSLATSPSGTLLTPPTVLAGTPPLSPTVAVGTPPGQSPRPTIAVTPSYTPSGSAPHAQITVLRVFRAIFYFVIAVPVTILSFFGTFNVVTGKTPLGVGLGLLLSIGLLVGSIVLFRRLQDRVQRFTWRQLMTWIVGATVGCFLLLLLLTALVPDTKGIVWSLFFGILLLLYGLALAGGMLW